MVDFISNSAPYYVRQAHFDSGRMAGTVASWKNNSAQSEVQPSQASSLAGTDTAQPNIVAPSLSFGEILDIVNPLHHLPIVGSVYRSLTNDTISPVARITGGAIYGGPIGGVVSIATAAIEEHSGHDVATALTDKMNQKKVAYSFHEDERSAGLNKSSSTKDEQPIEVASIASAVIPTKEHPILQINKNMFDVMETEKREPVTRVSIDVAVAKVKNDWGNLNA